MKGLILKDFYMAAKYCRSQLILAIVFFALYLAEGTNAFFLFYPCMLSGMVVTTLLAYDERAGWDSYALTMPYSRSQLVSAKFLVNLLVQALVVPLGIAVAGLRMAIDGSFRWEELGTLAVTLACIPLITGSVSLPFMFKLGVEKGRMAYYVMIGLSCALSVAAASAFEGPQTLTPAPWVLGLTFAGALAICGICWYASILAFSKRELK